MGCLCCVVQLLLLLVLAVGRGEGVEVGLLCWWIVDLGKLVRLEVIGGVVLHGGAVRRPGEGG